jgi:hypothetical protein
MLPHRRRTLETNLLQLTLFESMDKKLDREPATDTVTVSA